MLDQLHLMSILVSLPPGYSLMCVPSTVRSTHRFLLLSPISRYFQAVKVDRDRQTIFEEAIRDKERAEADAEQAERDAIVDKVKRAVQSLPGLTAESRFDTVLPSIRELPPFQPGGELAACHDLYILDAFADITDEMVRAADEAKKVAAAADRRALRHAREGFEALLAELERQGALTPMSLWKHLSKTIIADPRYVC